MADAVTNFSAISTDAPNVQIARETYRLAERRLQLGQFAKRYNLAQRMGKTLRIIRYKRVALPVATLTEGSPPDAVALSLENVDVTVEQWGIVVLLTDVALITTDHPALQIAVSRTAMAMAEMLEREMAQVLLAGTQVRYGAAATTRAGLDGTKKFATADALAMTTLLRANGAEDFEAGLYGGVIPPQVESDIIASDSVFQAASNFANVRRLDFGEIGVWQGVRWVRGNFLPIYKGQAAPSASAESGTLDAGTLAAQINYIGSGGSITNANFKFQVVWKDKLTGYERHISQASANLASGAGSNSFTVDVPAASVVNYVYDVYMTAAGGSGSLFKVLSNQTTATSSTRTTEPAGTEAVAPSAPAAAKEVFFGWVFGKDGFGRVELDGMSLQSYITPAGASYSNPLAQGRKVGSKVMWKSFIIDNLYFVRLEANSAYSANLPTG